MTASEQQAAEDQSIARAQWARDWAQDEFFAGRLRPLEKEEGSIMVVLMLSDAPRIAEMRTQIMGMFSFRVLKAHAKQVGLEMDDALMVFLSSVLKSPGESRMYCCALRTRYKRVTLSHLAMAEFSYGLPTETTLHSSWVAQKGDDDRNRLDALVAQDFEHITLEVQ